MTVAAPGVSFESLHCPAGLTISWGDGWTPGWSSSATLTNCTSTGEEITVQQGESLVMHDCRVFGVTRLPPSVSGRFFGSRAVACSGEMSATRCTFEGNEGTGASVRGAGATAELTECAIHDNGLHGLNVYEARATLRGGSARSNAKCGVRAAWGGRITVAAAADLQPQTVSLENEGKDWSTDRGGAIDGLLAADVEVVAL